jgi:hypothetical protein
MCVHHNYEFQSDVLIENLEVYPNKEYLIAPFLQFMQTKPLSKHSCLWSSFGGSPEIWTKDRPVTHWI